ncbi:MAG TPA: chemotaxis protein CheW [Syntrophorhabdaceae bacterium]|nr:chemotaxis protein CheW [Syntrophorhabdaceae bacterium]
MSVASIKDSRQYLTFKLGEEVFAMDVSHVREILEFNTITKVPKTPDYMRGVINLRGSVVPVLDMRLKFGMSETVKTVNTCVVVVEVVIQEETIVIGALVDSVQEVFELDPEQIEPPPKIGMQIKTDFIKGMGKRDDHFIIILDIDRLFSSEELACVEDVKMSGELN